MWPLSIVFLFALSAPQQTGPTVGQDFRAGKLPSIKIEPVKKDLMALPAVNANTCYAIRSYVFHRNNGQAPN